MRRGAARCLPVGLREPPPPAREPPCPEWFDRSGHVFLYSVSGALRRWLLLLFRRSLEILGEVAQDHLVERLVTDQVLAENRAASLGSTLSKRGGRPRGDMAPIQHGASGGRWRGPSGRNAGGRFGSHATSRRGRRSRRTASSKPARRGLRTLRGWRPAQGGMIVLQRGWGHGPIGASGTSLTKQVRRGGRQVAGLLEEWG
jgi:hypothetical protein